MPLKTLSPYLAFVLLGAGIDAQEKPRVRDLTDQEVTPELLTEVLRPRSAAPPGLAATRGARSLGTKTSCARYRERLSRGLGVEPAADIAAVEILFAFDSAELSPAASENLAALGRALDSPDLATCCFRIEGHADSIGSESYNLKLSERRAQSVLDYLSSTFPIEGERLMVVGYGESQPIADNESAEGRRKNRRVQIVNFGYGDIEP